MVRSLETIRVACIEIERVIDDRSVLARDIFRPDEAGFILIDASTATTAREHDVFLTWIYGIPGGIYRLSGLTQIVRDFGSVNRADALEIILKHLGAPDVEREKWMLEHLPRISQALTATTAARQYVISHTGMDPVPFIAHWDPALVPPALLEKRARLDEPDALG